MLRIFNHFSLPVTILFLVSSKLLGQESQNPKSQFIEAESFFLFEEYKDALPLYQKILRVEPDNYNISYKIGICYLNDLYQKEKSIKYLKDASQHAKSTASPTSFKEKFAPLEAHFYLGKAYRVNNRLDEAIESFQRFKDMADPKIFDVDLVNEEINACQRAKKMMSKPVYFTKKNLNGPVNTRFAETNAVISGDGKFLVFNRQLQFYNGVFISTKDNSDNWSEPVNLTPDFGLDGSSYTTGITFHGDEIFLYRSDDYDGNIYSSKLVNNKWSKLVKLNDNINTKFWESHASPSADGEYLFFTSNRPGGYGGLDIYKSKRGSNGDWGIAVNLGPVVNSPENEETPFLSIDGYTLFFSSLGHETMGGYDIFMSNLQSDGTWGKPVNLGYPFCTTDDDLFYCPSTNNSYGFISLFDASSTQGLSDIYATVIYNDLIPRTFTLKGKVDLEGLDSRENGKVSVKLINPETHQLISETGLEEDGSFALKVNQGNYKLVIEGSNLLPYTADINISVKQPDSFIILPPIKLNQAAGVVVPAIVTEKIIRSQISAKKDTYTVNDSSAIAIELNIPKGSDLHVVASVGSAMILTQDIKSVKNHFIYMYKPKEGENILKFTATDSDGNSSTTEVHVVYYPPAIPAEIISEKPDTSRNVPLTGVLSTLTGGKLSMYLLGLNSTSFQNAYQLYQYLLAHANEIGFTKAEVDKMFSIYYSQKNLPDFDHDLRISFGYSDSIWDPVLKKSTIPLQYIRRLLENGDVSDTMMSKSLLKIIVTNRVTSSGLITELDAFSKNKSVATKDQLAGLTTYQIYQFYADSNGAESARQSVQLASTTEDLEYFHQNLLLSSTGNLKSYLVNIRFKSNNIYTSIDLVEDLFRKADSMGFSNEDIIKALDMTKSNKSYYLKKFIDVLAADAKGTLKSKLQSIDLEKNNIRTYDDLIKYLLTQSQFNDVTKESILDLLLKLTGIKDTKELADRIRSYQNESINRALDDVSIGNFSTPIELLQYLLSSAGTYDYAESDINNLLIRMILEKGLESGNTDKLELVKHKLWKNPTFFSTIILVDIILVVLIILLVLRRKKNR